MAKEIRVALCHSGKKEHRKEIKENSKLNESRETQVAQRQRKIIGREEREQRGHSGKIEQREKESNESSNNKVRSDL